MTPASSSRSTTKSGRSGGSGSRAGSRAGSSRTCTRHRPTSGSAVTRSRNFAASTTSGYRRRASPGGQSNRVTRKPPSPIGRPSSAKLRPGVSGARARPSAAMRAREQVTQLSFTRDGTLYCDAARRESSSRRGEEPQWHGLKPPNRPRGDIGRAKVRDVSHGTREVQRQELLSGLLILVGWRVQCGHGHAHDHQQERVLAKAACPWKTDCVRGRAARVVSRFFALLLAVASMAGLLPNAVSYAAAVARPNILVILMDDQRVGTSKAMP